MTKQRGYYKLKIGGKLRTLHFSMNFWSAFCDELGIKLEQIGEVFANGLDLKTIRAIFYAGLLANDQEEGNEIDYTIFKVGAWLEDITPEQIQEVVGAMTESKILGNDLNMGIQRNPKSAGK